MVYTHYPPAVWKSVAPKTVPSKTSMLFNNAIGNYFIVDSYCVYKKITVLHLIFLSIYRAGEGVAKK